VTRLPAAEGVERFARANRLDAEALILEGGEEYVIVGTLRASRLEKAGAAVQKAGGQLMKIGRATAKKGLVELRSEGKTKAIRDVGWMHLRGS
jgi:thiamine monophosphate kinase